MAEKIVRNRKYFKPLSRYVFGPLIALVCIDILCSLFLDKGLSAYIANSIFAFDTTGYAGIHVSYFFYLKFTTLITGLVLAFLVPISEKLLHIYLLPRKAPYLIEVRNAFLDYLYK